MRMALRYSLFYGILLSAVFAVFFWSTESAVDEEIKTSLIIESTELTRAYEQKGLSNLVELIQQKQKPTATFLYLLIDSQENKLAGDLFELPDDFAVSKKVSNLLFAEEIMPRNRFDDDVYLPTISNQLTNGIILLIAHSTQQAETLLEVVEYLLEFTGAAIVLSLLIGLTLGYAILSRIKIITHTAEEIMKGDITQRIPLSNKNDEFDTLSVQLNTMMDRIQILIDSIREVTDNVAHDLRSPLTRLRNNFEVTLLKDRSSDDYRQTLTQGVRDVESLLNTFNALLSIAQVESGNYQAQMNPVNLSSLLLDVVELYEPLAEKKNQNLGFEQHEKYSMLGNRDLLAQAFSNLVENAIKYTPEHGLISIAIRQTSNMLEISFTDSGSGIPTNERMHVLERFVRLDSSRHTAGNGLGLSLVHAVCKLHHGKLSFSDAKPGLIVTISFPL